MSNELVTLRDIEFRIHEHMTGAVQHLIGVGKCLNEAKERKLVPHGGWENWVTANTGMGIRQAQKLMQAAAQVQENSAMMQLDITKVQMLLALPEPEREPMARKAADESMTVKQLKQEIDQLKRDKDEAEGLRLSQQQRMKDIMERIDALNRERYQASNERDALRLQVDELLANPRTVADPEQAREIERLREELADAEAYAEEQNAKYNKAREELSNRELCRADAPESITTTVNDVIRAASTFIGAAGIFPHMGAKLSGLSDKERNELMQNIEMVEAWCKASRDALNVVYIDVLRAR